jgi:hypothetical protein
MINLVIGINFQVLEVKNPGPIGNMERMGTFLSQTQGLSFLQVIGQPTLNYKILIPMKDSNLSLSSYHQSSHSNTNSHVKRVVWCMVPSEKYLRVNVGMTPGWYFSFAILIPM